MNFSRKLAALAPLALFAQVVFSVSCGGGGGSSSGPPPPPQPQTLQVVTSTIPSGFANKPYSTSLVAAGGTPPYTWSLGSTSNPLPAGLALSTAGVINGTPVDPAYSPYNCNLIIQVTDAGSRSASSSFSMLVYGLLRITTSSLAVGSVGIPYSQGLYASGGNPPYTYSVAPGSTHLPTGISINPSSGMITGTTTVPGNVDVDFQVQDTAPSSQTATRRLSLNIFNDLVVATTLLPIGVIAQPYNQTILGAGGTPPYTFSYPNGPIFGLSFHPDGQVTGPPTQSGSGGILVRITDSASPPAGAAAYVQIYIRSALSIGTTVIFDAIRNTPYSGAIQIGGGTPPQSLRVTSGTLPDDLHLETVDTTNGLFYIRGTPTTAGNTNFTIEASDSSSPPVLATQALTLRVFDRLVMSVPPLPPSLVGDPFSATFTATGGLPPYSWRTGGVPPGLTLDSVSGVLSGTSTAPYDSSFSLYVTDSGYPLQLNDQYPHITIVGRLHIATTTLPPVMVGVPVQIGLAATGGTGVYTWTIVSGSLPAGLTLDTTTSKITGTPTVAETKTINLRVDDLGPPPQTSTRTLSLTSSSAIGRNDSIATATSLSNGTYRASISPADDGSPTAHPDNDFYAVTANPGAIVAVEIKAHRLTPKASLLDSVIEILDATGTRLTSCDYYSIAGEFSSPCMNDDIPSAYTYDSRLFLKAPGAPGDPPVTFYVRVLDWSGTARPEFVYTITITGAN